MFCEKRQAENQKIGFVDELLQRGVRNSKFLDFIEKIKVSEICVFVEWRAKN